MPPETKRCGMCGEVKPLDEFHRDARNKTHGRQNRCKPCNVIQARRLRATPEARARYNDWIRLHRYGVTVEQYIEMVDKQNGVCAICELDLPLNIDHNHETGVVRGLLCTNCNQALGKMKDSTDLLKRAIAYLDGVL